MSNITVSAAYSYISTEAGGERVVLARHLEEVEERLAAVTAERNKLRENRDDWMSSCQNAETHRDGANAQLAEYEKTLATVTAERDALLIELRAALVASPMHIFTGWCPVPERFPNDRDSDCPVCRRLTEIDAAIAASKGKP